MTRILAIVAACALSLSVYACGSPGAQDATTTFLKAEAGYTVLLQAAARYVALPRCGSTGATEVCSDQKIVDQIRPAANSADATIQAAEDTITNNPSSDALQFALSAAQNATQALTVLMSQYNIPVK